MDTTKTAAPTAPDADTAEQGTPRAADARPALQDAPEDTAAPASAEAGDEQELDEDLRGDGLLGEQDDPQEQPTGVGSAAGAVVAAGLGLVALSGSWVSRVIAERQTLIGQIESVNAATTEAKIQALYGDAWHMTALVNGVLSTLALLLAVFVLARPAFSVPGRVHPTWVRAVSWAAVALGALGILLFGLMYFDILVPLPKAA
ncbi:hypothetical protein AB0B01_14375 [Streptomyces sp. NPDC044571]|uniref:hypothetical protein n=1 Tax=Streptomyces sp. NPDC044571 TaxID=3155371 RepID=UPI0033C1E0A3